MKTLYFTLTILLSSLTFAISTSGSFATQKIVRALGSDVLYGRTASNQPCVVDVMFPNPYHDDTIIRVYPGSKIADVPTEAAWIRIEPKNPADYVLKGNSLIVRASEIKPDEEGYTKTFSQIYLGFDPMIQKRIITIKTQSTYVHMADRNAKSSTRMSLLTCYVGR